MIINKLKTTPLDSMIDKYIGKIGTKNRETFERQVKIDVLNQIIKRSKPGKKATRITSSQ